MTDANRWPETPAARALLERAKPEYFHRTTVELVFGRPRREWRSDTPEGREILESLGSECCKAVTEEVGYDPSDIDWSRSDYPDEYKNWLRRLAQTPSPSDALEAEFRRRGERWPDPRTVLTDALRGMIGDAELVAHEPDRWSGIRVLGHRYRFTVTFDGKEAVELGKRVKETLPERLFDLPGQIVMDASVEAEEFLSRYVPQLRIWISILAQDDPDALADDCGVALPTTGGEK